MPLLFAPHTGILPAKLTDQLASQDRKPLGTFSTLHPYFIPEDVMRAYLANLTPKTRMLLAVPAIVIAYVIVTIVVPAVVHAAVPEVVRSVLKLI
jgi:hypothetical protein